MRDSVDHAVDLSFDKDLLDRHSFGRGILRLIENGGTSGVLALDSEWGTGKTYFLCMLRKLLEDDGYGVIYVDAFESDLGAEAFTTLVGAVLAAYDDWNLGSPDKRSYFKNSAINVAKGLARITVGVALKAATAGIVDLPQTSAAIDAAVEETAERTRAALDNMLEERAKHDDTVREFRRALSELPSAFAAARGKESKSKIIFIIDELDRCRPNYAVDILEVIKHYFDVEDVFFIIAGDFDVISKSVEHAYGISGMGRRYLQKIIPYYVSFPNLKDRNLVGLAGDVARRLGDKTEGRHSGLITGCAELLIELVRTDRISMRDLDRIVQMGATAFALVSERTLAPPPIVVALLVIRHLSPSIYRSIRDGEVPINCILELLRLQALEDSSPNSLIWMRDWLLAFSSLHQTANNYPYEFVTGRYSISSRESVLPIVANRVIDVVWQDAS